MSISAPSEAIPLPEDIKRGIEAGQNQVTLLKGEESRLIRLKGQIEKEIGTLNATKTNLEESISGFVASNEDLKDRNNNLNDLVKSAQGKLDTIKTEETTTRDAISSLNADLADKQAGIKADREQLTQDQTALILDKQLHEKDKAELAKKVELLSNTINSL